MFLVTIKKNSFTSAISLAQISEFSLILVLTVPFISEELFSTTILLAIISIALTSYIIKYELQIYGFFTKPLSLFEHLALKKKHLAKEYKNHKEIVLIGYHRMGTIFMKVLNKMKKRVLVIDYNPEAIERLQEQKIACAYGDIANPEFIKKINFSGVKVIITSIPKEQDNIALLKHLTKIKSKSLKFVTANHLHEALTLYDLGADYVIIPHIMSGESVSLILDKYLNNKPTLTKIKREHLKHLLEMNDESKR